MKTGLAFIATNRVERSMFEEKQSDEGAVQGQSIYLAKWQQLLLLFINAAIVLRVITTG